MDPNELKILNIARRVAEFNCLFNHKYDTNALTQDSELNKTLSKDREKLDIVIRNSLNGIETETILSSHETKRIAKVNDIITEINFLLE
jgi:vacuolar-type H+-ATPase subunit B/Vma2